MARTKAAATTTTDITVPRSVLKQFVSLVEGLRAADTAYKACQATLFRNFAQGAYRAANMKAAYEQAKEALEKSE